MKWIISIVAILAFASFANGQQCQVKPCSKGYMAQRCIWNKFDCSTVPPNPTIPYDFTASPFAACECKNSLLECIRYEPCSPNPIPNPVCTETPCIHGMKTQYCTWDPIDCSVFASNPLGFGNANCGCFNNVAYCKRSVKCP